ncbi:hypothetical protein NBRC116592_12340 [Colwellia sp. KU-HH00111]|uniref:hypothetical protein n=1 Tax=Colwellia sp. KU-HH00111 TaxID=3127652 RepID=UPI003102813D
MPDCLGKIVDYLLNGANDKAFIEIQSKKKMHSYSDSEWAAVICHLNREDIVKLIKNLISIRKRNKLHIGGSVSPVRWLYKFYIENYNDDNNELFDWIAHNSENPYEPMGSYQHNHR